MNLTKTIAELMIVVTLMAGGGTLTVNAMGEIMLKARDVSRAANAHQISLALELYNSDHATFPIYTGSDANVSWQTLRQAFVGTYLQTLPNDPSPDHAYRYWSDGKIAKVFYFSEVLGAEQERWNF